MNAVAPAAVAPSHLMAMHALPGRSEPLDRPLGTLVENVGAKGDALQPQRLERVSQKQQLGLRVSPGSPRGATEPGRADLDVCVVSVEVPVGGGADHRPGLGIEDGERESTVRFPVREGAVDPGARLAEVHRPGIGKPGEDLLGVRGSEQAGRVFRAQRLDRDQIASQFHGLNRMHGLDPVTDGGAFWEAAGDPADHEIGRWVRNLQIGLSEQPLDDQHVSPGAVELTVAAVQADGVKTAALGQPDTRDVVGEELADHLVEAALFGRCG